MMNGYQQYKTQSVSTMTKGEMLILLYDEILKRMKRAELEKKENQIEQFEADIQRAIEIINYLSKSLDMKYPISMNLYRLYDFFTFQLNRVKASRDIKLLEDLYPMISELRDSFKEADKKTKTDPRVGAGIGGTTGSIFGVG